MSREMSTASSATVKDREAGDEAESVPVTSRRLRSAARLQHDVPTPKRKHLPSPKNMHRCEAKQKDRKRKVCH